MTEGAGPPQLPPSHALDRRSVERVLARAAELQATSSGAGAGDTITEAQLVEIAKEVGLDAAHVRQAIAEDRTRRQFGDETGLVARLFGGPCVGASRTIAGTQADLLAALDKTMQRDECLRVQRRFPDRLIWEARQDVLGMLKRGLGIGGRRYDLARADSVSATVVPVDDKRCLVSLEADVRDTRSTRLTSSAVVAGSGAVVAGIVAMLAVAVPEVALVPLVGSSGVAWFVARGHKSRVARLALALEQALDRLEYRETRPPGALASALSAARPLLR